MKTQIAIIAALALAAPLAARAQDQQLQQNPASMQQGPSGMQPSGQEGAQNVQGTFRLAVPEDQAKQNVNAAIDEAASHTGFFERGFVKSRLRDKNPVRDTIQTNVNGNQLSVQYGDMRYQTQQGRWTTVTALGEQVQLQQWARGNQIVQKFRSDEGEKVSVMTFQPNGEMVMDVTVYSQRLPQPLHYQLQYRRAGGAGSMAAG